jgi:hypothetical protein
MSWALLAAGAESSVEEVGRLALLHSTQRRFSRTHMNTVNMSVEVRCVVLWFSGPTAGQGYAALLHHIMC